MAGAKVAVTVKRAMPIGCFDAGRYVRITSKESGMSTPPVKPCRTRKRIINSRERACPQQIEKKTNRNAFTRRYFFSENVADSHEVNGITTISATRYEV